ncbi:hypothetical protein SUGI_0676840 [Cryptomeria japonica]|nr:hypothetical protein SUGI_0676840 [Cryptomeria japonica]
MVKCQKILASKEDSKGNEEVDTDSSTHVSNSAKDDPIDLIEGMMLEDEEDVTKNKKATYQNVAEGTCSKCLKLEMNFAKIKEIVQDIGRKIGSVSRFGLRVMHSCATTLCLLYQNIEGPLENYKETHKELYRLLTEGWVNVF